MSEDEPAQIYEANPLLRVLYRRFFDAIQVDQRWVDQVQRLAEQGSIVYVLRSLNVVDLLALDHLTKRFDLPRVRYANDLRLGLLQPIGGGLFSRLASRADPTVALSDALVGGGSAALFLKRPPSMLDVATGGSHGRGLSEGDPLIQALMELQRRRGTPILLVPQVFVWTNRPDTQGANWLDPFFGPREWPSSLRTVGQFLYNYRHVELKAGEPFDLQAYLESAAPRSDAAHVRHIVHAMLRRLERERRIVTGPALKPPDRERHQIVRSPKLQATIKHMAGERPEDRRALIRKALKLLREIQATPDSATIKALEVLLDRVFHRIYAGIDVDEKGIQRMRELSRDGSLVLLPSHKSHVDYLVLSFIFNEERLQLPVIAAGDNLSFFPLGPVLRRAGAFFIRRSFRGDKLYSTTVEAYVRRMMRDGHTIELFLEGGRSRTGKLLPPKYGLLMMLVDAALSVSNRKVYFVPASIGYERIVETGSYERELSGGDKEREDAAGLLKSTEVLRHRYGRINVQFGSEMTLESIRRDLGLPERGSLSPGRRRALVMRLANRTMDEINRVSAVTPAALTALALLSDRTLDLPHDELLIRCRKLVKVLHAMGARATPRTAMDGDLRPPSIREAAQLFLDAELMSAHGRDGEKMKQAGRGAIYRIPDRKRVQLDTAKNHIVHFFVERGLVATALLMPGPFPVEIRTVRARVLALSKLFKHEFRFRAEGFEHNFQDTLRTMTAAGEIRVVRSALDIGEGRDGWSAHVWLTTYAWILRNFLEAYRVAARSLTALQRGPLSPRDVVRRGLALGAKMHASGEIRLREAISKPLIENAYLAFVDEGYVALQDGKYVLAESLGDAESVKAIEGRLVGMLDLRDAASLAPAAEE